MIVKTIHIGVIGIGTMGERHCRVCANLPRVELVGIADLNEKYGRQVASRYETAYFANHHDLLSQVDAVTIAASTPAHYTLAAECLDRGLPVLVEKPIAETVEQAQQLVNKASERGLLLQVGHIERFNPAFTELKHVTEGMTLIGINMRRLSPFDTSNIDVDVIRDLMIHDLDLAVDLVGSELEGITAWGRSVNTNAIDHAVANLSFRDGPIATVFASRVTEQKVRAIEVIAAGAYIEANLLNKSVLIHRRTFPQYLDNHHTTRYRQESVIERIHVPMYEPLMLELRHFVDCVRENRPSQVPGSDGLRALRLAHTVTTEMARVMKQSPPLLTC
ncbi:MAG: gfo/Idh/MocA family oxidoreductase [Chloroflexi bacterium]|nr:MAG: gfo/Idh/MocA family oxidoreductase [Chloroflexota bacterium]